MNKRLLIPVCLAACVALACAAPSLVPTAEPLPSPSPTWTLLPAASPTPEPSATLAPASGPTESAATATQAPPTNTALPFSCPNAPVPRVQIGDRARVTFTDGLPLRVRESPIVGNNVVAQIAEGTEFSIVGGPECAAIPDAGSSFVFWKIENESSGLSGWVAEGSGSTYYIEVVP